MRGKRESRGMKNKKGGAKIFLIVLVLLIIIMVALFAIKVILKQSVS